MTRLASRFGATNLVRRDRPLTREELAHYVPSVFSEDKHESRSDRYTYIPTITLLDNLKREGFQPFFACQTRASVSTPNTCCAYAEKDKSLANRFRKSFCLTAMMAPAHTRCCRGYSERFAKMG